MVFPGILSSVISGISLWAVLVGASISATTNVLPFPKVGPIVRYVTTESVAIMGQGDKKHLVSGIYRYAKINEDKTLGPFSGPYLFPMNTDDRSVGRLWQPGLDPDTSYAFQVGYIEGDQINGSISWKQAHYLKVITNSLQPSAEFSFLVGSCRRLGRIAGISFWKKEGDLIFDAMCQNIRKSTKKNIKTNFIAFIGDQIYADATHPLGDDHTFKDYASRYELAFSQPFIRSLMSKGPPVYMIRDDHEWWNDADKESQDKKPEQSASAQRTYDLFQRPFGSETERPYYTISGDLDVFFTDTRSEREPSKNQIISLEQMEKLKAWLIRPELNDRIKVVMTSVPILLLQTSDSWGGSKEQQKEILSYILENHVQDVVFVSGDAHCENDGLFVAKDYQDTVHGYILEVLVSGFFAVSRHKAGLLTGDVNLMDGDNGYRFTVDGGLKPTLTENLYARISGNHETKQVTIEVFNKNNEVLKNVTYDLRAGTAEYKE